MQQEYKLRLEGVSKAFPGVVALDDVSFGIKKGSVHAIMGENGAGKSTLMKIINGSQEPTEGKIYLDGKEVSFNNIHEAEINGVGMIYQETQYIPDMSIERYMMLCREKERKIKGFINWKETERLAREQLKNEGLDYDGSMPMRELTISDMQILEITKAVSSKTVDVLIMDEPTSALSNKEIENLFKKIKQLKDRGITVIYISHKMDEVFQISDYITVLRDGKHIQTKSIDAYTPESLVTLMVGREIDNVYPKEQVEHGDVALEVKGLNALYSQVRDVSFYVKKGEILGLAGLVGSGRTETVRALFGLDPIASGEIFVDNKKIEIKSVNDAVKNGIVMATEDRRRYGLILCRSIRENISLPILKRLKRGFFLNKNKEKSEVKGVFDRLQIKAPDDTVHANTLSGGNQQKVVLAKWMLASPKVLILDEPTRGIDVGAKYEIYKLMVEMARTGIAIIMISSEYPEFISMCDRCYTMCNGRITHELSKEEMTTDNIISCCTGGKGV